VAHRNEVVNSSLVVMVTLAFFVLFTFIVDSISVYVITLIGRIGG
jgi:preprotein translocase SecE subunit